MSIDDQDLPKKDRPVPSSSSEDLAGAIVSASRHAKGSKEGQDGTSPNRLHLLPIRDAVLFPHNVLPLTAGKEWASGALERALKLGDRLGVVTQRDPHATPTSMNDLHEVGTEARILKIIRFPDGTQGAVVQGSRRFRILKAMRTQKSTKKLGEFLAEVEYFNEVVPLDSLRVSALGRGLRQLVQKAISLSPNVPNEANLFIENVTDPAYLADVIIPYLGLDTEKKQSLLEIADLETRLEQVHLHLAREIEILEVSQKIYSDVRSEVGKQQRRFYLKEQLKLLQKELGEVEGREPSHLDEASDLAGKIRDSRMPQEAKDTALREVERLNIMQPGSPEYMVSHTYVSWLLNVPWGIETQTSVDLKLARSILDEDHFGLDKIKKRILEYLAVYALKSDLKGPILLLSGPPGVGKTSLGRSVARALGRKFVRISLGGLRDEAEIRGHRRTYIGSLPGKIVESLNKAGSMDPVILLDEIDKLGQDMRGDPASALLEVLDPEQNQNFVDHYLSTPVDLSKVMFIATANTTSTIPAPLLDRMEPIPLPGYTFQEKIAIARRFLIPQVMVEHGLTNRATVKIPDTSVREVIESYTREAGVRQLKRELSGLARSVALHLVEDSPASTEAKGRKPSMTVRPAEVAGILGPKRFLQTERAKLLPPGVALGLAYTPVGGDVLYVEAASPEGDSQGRLVLTGQLGDVMKESVQTALTFLRSNRTALSAILPAARRSGQAEPFLTLLKKDIHVHFPEGAIPKDGPSAGVAVLCALVSLATGRSLSNKLAMTGEISLRGSLLPVGGIKEKLLAAHRHGIKDIILPRENEKDLSDLPEEVRHSLHIHLMSTMLDALSLALGTANTQASLRAGASAGHPSEHRHALSTKKARAKSRGKASAEETGRN